MIRKTRLVFNFATKIFKDHYKTLRIQYTASEKDIKLAYKALAKLYHPDMTEGHE